MFPSMLSIKLNSYSLQPNIKLLTKIGTHQESENKRSPPWKTSIFHVVSHSLSKGNLYIYLVWKGFPYPSTPYMGSKNK